MHITGRDWPAYYDSSTLKYVPENIVLAMIAGSLVSYIFRHGLSLRRNDKNKINLLRVTIRNTDS